MHIIASPSDQALPIRQAVWRCKMTNILPKWRRLQAGAYLPRQTEAFG